MQQLPQKEVYKLSEVCRFTETQPYVLRFWESEFPQLNPGKSASGQRLYKKKDIAVVCRIKELLYAEARSVADARKQLADDLAQGKRLKIAPPTASAPAEPTAEEVPSPPPARVRARPSSARPIRDAAEPVTVEPEMETVSRQRYEDAVDEIDHLRMALREAEKNLHRAENVAEEARGNAEREQARAERALDHIERVLKLLS